MMSTVTVKRSWSNAQLIELDTTRNFTSGVIKIYTTGIDDMIDIG